MPAGAGVETYIDLVDFTPGIYDSYHGITSDVATAGPKDGAVRRAGTWGCYGRKNGGLYPLFKVTQTKLDDIAAIQTAGSITAPSTAVCAALAAAAERAIFASLSRFCRSMFVIL